MQILKRYFLSVSLNKTHNSEIMKELSKEFDFQNLKPKRSLKTEKNYCFRYERRTNFFNFMVCLQNYKEINNSTEKWLKYE